MTRDFDSLEHGPFDVLVIGGGIYGAWVAYDAALRGLRVALVERDDWAAGTSSASSKLIHGGLRYLEYGRLGLVRKSLAERLRLRRLAPHRVESLRFVLPVYSGGRVGRWRLRLGIWLYERIGGRSTRFVPRESLGRRELLQRYGFLKAEGLTGGVAYGDCRTDDARFVLEIVDGALQAGVVAVNRAAVGELLVDGRRVLGARVRDGETGRSLEIRAEVTVNCAGPWGASLLPGAEQHGRRLSRLSKGVHLVMPPLPTEDAFLLLSAQRGRVVFLIPWYGKTLLGTTDTDYPGDPDKARVAWDDVDYLLAQVNRVFTGPGWRAEDIVSSFVGLRTLPFVHGSSSPSISRELIIEEPLERLIMPVGGKYTSARVDAARIVDLALTRLGLGRLPCPTRDRLLPWAPRGRYRHWSTETLRRGLALGLDEDTVLSCQSRYGSRLEWVYELIEKLPKLAARIVPDAPFCLAEIVHAAKYEMACSLEDVLLRRIPLLLVSPPDDEGVRSAARMVGRVLGWSEERRSREIASLARASAGP